MSRNMHAQRVIDGILADVQRANPGKDCSVADIAACDDEVIRAYRTDVRVKVSDQHGREPTGTVGRTTGWRPALLLMHRSNDSGSSDVLGPGHRIVAVRRGGVYVPATSLF